MKYMHYISMFALLIDVSYKIKENSECKPYSNIYDTLSDAKTECRVNPGCVMVFDIKGSGKTTFSCDTNATIQVSQDGSILYIKTREIICICTSYFSIKKNNMVKLLIIE